MTEPKATCREEECTVATTGVCARTGEPTPCERAVTSVEQQVQELVGEELSNVTENMPPVGETGAGSLFYAHPGMELGLEDAAELMQDEHVHMVAILGEQDAGKTLFLVALYLLLACGLARDWRFVGSRTLPGFEGRARATRQWVAGGVPEQMSARTRGAEDRGAGFLHLELQRRLSGRRCCLLLSDIPGEWSSNLVANARHAPRLGFLKRSDAILVMVDGNLLTEPATRHATVESHCILIDRVATIVGQLGRPLALIATRGDRFGMQPPQGLADLVQHARDAGFVSIGVTAASISGVGNVASGAGIFEALEWILAPRRAPSRARRGVRPPAGRLFGWIPSAEVSRP